MISVEQVAERVDYGVTDSASNDATGRKFLRITDIQDGLVDWSAVPYCSADAKGIDKAELASGDIVFARTGATTGKSFLVRSPPKGSVFASYLIRLRLGPSADPAYVAHFFRSPGYWQQISTFSEGVAQPGVNATKLKQVKVPLPEIEEQRRIAAVLDAADDLRTKRREALAKFDTLTQAIFIDMFGDPLASNETTLLGEIVDFVGGGTPSKSVPEYYEGENCWATSKDMKCAFITDTQDHVTDEAIANSATKLVPDGSVLVVVKSKVLAKRLPVAITRVQTCFGQDLKAGDPG